MATLKQVDIQVNAVKRLTKEMKSRRVDVETEKKRTEKFIAQGEDKWTVGKQEEVVAEAQRMIPDSKQRLENGLTDLEALLKDAGPQIPKEKREEAEDVIKDGKAALQG